MKRAAAKSGKALLNRASLASLARARPLGYLRARRETAGFGRVFGREFLVPNDVTRMGLREVSPEVIYSDGGFLAVDRATIELLKNKARQSPRRRCRLCFHADTSAAQQEMLIVMHRSAYVRPHRHSGKVETLGIVEGRCDAVLFDATGTMTDVIAMSPAGDGGCFFYRMPPGIFHTLVFRSEWLVFLETTIGPFDRSTTEEAAWAPPETDAAAGRAYLSRLMQPAQ